MIAIPAVDLRGGACVQLVGGSYEQERVRLDDPLSVARDWAAHGFRRLHLVDLDAATGRGTNEELVRDILGDRSLEMQVGGGIRSGETIERLLAEGARHVVVGTRALEEMAWLAEMTSLFPRELIVAADVRDRRIVTRGWARTLPRDILDAVEELNDLPLAGLLVTAVHKEGRLGGTDLPLMEDVAELSEAPVIASGGITTMNDLRALADRGVAATVIGMALYTGALDPRLVADEFSE
jgi:phosphoribosylformimino-5-aminoimidazole carboxamide ribotide isomerase